MNDTENQAKGEPPTMDKRATQEYADIYYSRYRDGRQAERESLLALIKGMKDKGYSPHTIAQCIESELTFGMIEK